MTTKSSPLESEMNMDDVKNLIKRKDDIEEQIKAYYDVLEDVSLLFNIDFLIMMQQKATVEVYLTRLKLKFFVYYFLTARCRTSGTFGGRRGLPTGRCKFVPNQSSKAQYFM